VKPRDARAAVKSREAIAAARGVELEHRLRTGEELDAVVPELIPDEDDLVVVLRDLRKALQVAKRRPKGAARSKALDEAIGLIARLVYVERVLALDRLDRASLTPRRLSALSTVTKPTLQTRYGQMLLEERAS
jgi:hypothetical protein